METIRLNEILKNGILLLLVLISEVFIKINDKWSKVLSHSGHETSIAINFKLLALSTAQVKSGFLLQIKKVVFRFKKYDYNVRKCNYFQLLNNKFKFKWNKLKSIKVCLEQKNYFQDEN